jgi:hypothetical protein
MIFVSVVVGGFEKVANQEVVKQNWPNSSLQIELILMVERDYQEISKQRCQGEDLVGSFTPRSLAIAL